MLSYHQFGGFNPPGKGPQQGVLFRDSSLTTPQHRWDAGYTPERKEAVGRAIPVANVVAGPAVPGGTKLTMDNPRESLNLATKRRGEGVGAHLHTASTVARNKIVDTVARSTVPTEHLRVAPTFMVGPRREGQSRGSYESPTYLHGREPMRSALPDVQERLDYHADRRMAAGNVTMYISESDTPQRTEQTLLHELGHSRSQAVGNQSSYYNTPQRRGMEEARADTYMREHYVPRRGKSGNVESSAYEHLSTWGTLGTGEGAEEAHASYLAGRRALGNPVLPAQPKQYPGSYDPNAPQQGRLFARPVDTIYTDTEKDYGQWGYRHHEGHELEQLPTGTPPPREQRMREGHPFTIADLGEQHGARPELTAETRKKVGQRLGLSEQETRMIGSTREAMHLWGKAHPHLGWAT